MPISCPTFDLNYSANNEFFKTAYFPSRARRNNVNVITFICSREVTSYIHFFLARGRESISVDIEDFRDTSKDKF